MQKIPQNKNTCEFTTQAQINYENDNCARPFKTFEVENCRIAAPCFNSGIVYEELLFVNHVF